MIKLYSLVSTISYILHILIWHYFPQYFYGIIYKSGLSKLCFDNFNNLLKLLVVIYLGRSTKAKYTYYNMIHYKISFVNTQSGITHPYCFFSTESQINDYIQMQLILCNVISCEQHAGMTNQIEVSTLPIYYIKNKALNEGIYKILFNQKVWDNIHKILIEINAKNIYPINTIFLKNNNIKQHEPIFGQFKIEFVEHHPKFD